jgi:hypothetical protein
MSVSRYMLLGFLFYFPFGRGEEGEMGRGGENRSEEQKIRS